MTARNASSSTDQTYAAITGSLVTMIESSGTLPWERPWSQVGTDAPISVRGHVYRGINRVMLGMAAQVLGYSDPRWITFNQAKESGGHVRKGEKSLPCILFRPVERERPGEEEPDRFLVARTFRVFNVEQCDGLDLARIEQPDPHDWQPLEECERIVATMPARPAIRHQGGRAFYSPSADAVTMPERERFASPEGYYGVLFHELAHATGHESRLARDLSEIASFGDANYSREELVAEMASAFVCGTAGIDTPPAERNHAAYLASWLRVLRADARALVTAAARASRAADWILGTPARITR